MVQVHQMDSRSPSVKRCVSWKDSDDISVFAEKKENGDMTCGVAGLVRSASFRRSKKEPHWVTSKYTRTMSYIQKPIFDSSGQYCTMTLARYGCGK